MKEDHYGGCDHHEYQYDQERGRTLLEEVNVKKIIWVALVDYSNEDGDNAAFLTGQC